MSFLAFDLAATVSLQTAFVGPLGAVFSVFAARWLIFFALGLSLGAAFLERNPSRRHVWNETAWSVGLACVASLALAFLAQRLRPFVAHPEMVRLLVPIPSSPFSWPSMHAATAAAWAAGIVRLEPRFWWAWAAVAGLVAFGRVLVGVHYLSDVLSGALLGLAAHAFVRWGHRFLRRLAPSLV